MTICDIIVATTGVADLIKPEMVRKGQIILALSNPNAEIKPDVALKAGAAFAKMDALLIMFSVFQAYYAVP